MHFVKWPPVYVKHTLSKTGTFHRACRLHQMHIRKIECRLAYGKCYSFWKSDVSSTPNAYFGGRADPNEAEPGRTAWWWLRVTNSPITKKCFCKKKEESRLHQTPIFLASIFWGVVDAWDIRFCLATAPFNERLVYVKHIFSTNYTFQRASRLHQMHIRKIECRLVYGKCSFFEKNASRLDQT